MILGTLHLLLLTAVVVLVVMALLAPLESLRWWAGWSDREAQAAAPTAPPGPPPARRGDERYVVWLSGIGSVPGQTEDPFEVRFLRELRARVPQAVIIDDAFAYSVRDNPLAGRQLFDPLWRRARRGQAAGRPPGLWLGRLVQLRNTLQVAVSADARYGPIYNLGLAEGVGKRLLAHGYPSGSGTPIYLLGYSGGGQIAVGAAPYLKRWLGAPIEVVSIGGVISPDPGLEAVDHLYHLQGQKDPVPGLGSLAFPGRWPLLRYSAWNKTVAAGKLTVIRTGPMGHMAEPGYFGSGHVEKTASVVAAILAGAADGRAELAALG
jgi:hypothetical protein